MANLSSIITPTNLVTLTGTATLTNKTLTAPTIASANLTTALTLAGAAGTNGQVLTSAGSGLPSWTTPAGGPVLGTPATTTSGTSVDYTGIPAGTKRITVNFVGVSTSDATQIIIQLGDSGGFESSGYTCLMTRLADGSTVSSTTSPSGFSIYSTSAAAILSGSIVINLENSTSNTWCAQGCVGNTASLLAMSVTAGSKSLSAELDRITIIGAFDAGQINISYE